MVIIQDAAVTVLAIVGAAILARKLTRAMRPKTAAACDHCPSGAAAQQKPAAHSPRESVTKIST